MTDKTTHLEVKKAENGHSQVPAQHPFRSLRDQIDRGQHDPALAGRPAFLLLDVGFEVGDRGLHRSFSIARSIERGDQQ